MWRSEDDPRGDKELFHHEGWKTRGVVGVGGER